MTQEGYDEGALTDEDDGEQQPTSAFFGRLVSAGRENDLRLTLPEHTVGRAATASLSLKYNFISSLHARIHSSEAGVTVEDCSTNGMWVNGSKLPSKSTQALNHNDELMFKEGNNDLRFTFIAAHPPAATSSQEPAAPSAVAGSPSTPVLAEPKSATVVH